MTWTEQLFVFSISWCSRYTFCLLCVCDDQNEFFFLDYASNLSAFSTKSNIKRTPIDIVVYIFANLSRFVCVTVCFFSSLHFYRPHDRCFYWHTRSNFPTRLTKHFICLLNARTILYANSKYAIDAYMEFTRHCANCCFDERSIDIPLVVSRNCLLRFISATVLYLHTTNTPCEHFYSCA